MGSADVVIEQTPAYAVRDYRPEDEDGVLTLLRLALGGGRSFVRDQAFWRWKHLENHFGQSHLMLAANSEVLGLRAFMRWQFQGPAGPMRAVRAVDTATHPGHRRLGIFSRLTQASLERLRAEGVHLIFNTPNAQSMAGYLKLGWQLVGRPRLLIRPIRPLRMAAGFLMRRRATRGRAELEGFFRRPPHSIEELLTHQEQVATIIKFNDGLCAQGIRTARSVEFLRWRYAAAPSLPYGAVWTGGAPVTGLVIVRPSYRLGMREIMLCEFLVGYGNAPHARELIAQVIEMTDADYLVAAGTPGTQHWGLLRRAGFVPLPPNTGPNITVFPLNYPPGEVDPVVLQHWHFSLGDLEVF